MKLLLLADKESRYLWDFYKPGCLREYDLMLSCGDLKAEYLTFLATLGRSPLLYVRGNHDDNYESRPPEGCECIEDKLVTVDGLRIVGLGGSPLYSGGRNQYTERQMEARIRKLGWKIRRAGGVDIVVTHAPPYGLGDGDDPAHWGFESLVELLDTYHPQYLVHGHVHIRYGARERVRDYNGTTLINATERYTFEIPDRPVDGKQLGQVIYKTRQKREDPLERHC